jgi:hypothetical protein
MILNISCQAIMVGKNFNPNQITIPTNIRIVEKLLIGDEIEFNRNKGELSAEGSLIIDGEVDAIIEFLTIEMLSQITLIEVDLNICIVVCYEGQCNFELSFEQIEKLSLLKVPIGITCYSCHK